MDTHPHSPAIAGSDLYFLLITWGLRPRLYAAARFAGSVPVFT